MCDTKKETINTELQLIVERNSLLAKLPLPIQHYAHDHESVTLSPPTHQDLYGI